SKRDTGESVITLKNKKISNSKLLRTPLGFFVRLLRSNIFMWIIVIICFGMIYGYLLDNIDDFMKSITYLTPNYTKGDATKEYIAAMFPLLAIICTIPAIISTKKAFEEEHSYRLEIIYSKSVQKIYPLNSTVFIAVGQAILNLLILFITFWGTARYGVNCKISYFMILKTSMMFLPAILIFISLIAILTAFLPKLVNTIWLYYAYTIFVIIFGKTLKLSHLFLKISPFGWISKYPINHLNVNHQILLYGVSVILIFLAFLGYRRRDKLRY
ncbi:hypothetical protein LGW56_09790, partial [Streptococcus mutans]|nr:hypothetical protein [Streptococcus mutans]